MSAAARVNERNVRVVALWRDDPLRARLTVDLRIDAAGAVVSVWDVFGAFDLDGAAQPFVLRRDGRIDFGAGRDGRGWRTDLRAARVAVGGRFRLFWNEADSGEYEIVKVAEPGGKTETK